MNNIIRNIIGRIDLSNTTIENITNTIESEVGICGGIQTNKRLLFNFFSRRLGRGVIEVRILPARLIE